MRGYPFSCEVQVRWRDLDAFAHVNNAVFATYFEMARVQLWRKRLGGPEAGDIQFVLARIEIDYRRPIKLQNRVEVGIRLADLGRASFTLEYRMTADGELAADGRSTQVCVNERGRPGRVPETLKRGLESLS